jgi:hypothetical protein
LIVEYQTKISLHFVKDVTIFCEGERRRHINANNRNDKNKDEIVRQGLNLPSLATFRIIGISFITIRLGLNNLIDSNNLVDPYGLISLVNSQIVGIGQIGHIGHVGQIGLGVSFIGGFVGFIGLGLVSFAIGLISLGKLGITSLVGLLALSARWLNGLVGFTICSLPTIAAAAILSVAVASQAAEATILTSATEIADVAFYYFASSLLHVCLLVREKMCWWLALARKKMWLWITSFGDSYHGDASCQNMASGPAFGHNLAFGLTMAFGLIMAVGLIGLGGHNGGISIVGLVDLGGIRFIGPVGISGFDFGFGLISLVGISGFGFVLSVISHVNGFSLDGLKYVIRVSHQLSLVGQISLVNLSGISGISGFSSRISHNGLVGLIGISLVSLVDLVSLSGINDLVGFDSLVAAIIAAAEFLVAMTTQAATAKTHGVAIKLASSTKITSAAIWYYCTAFLVLLSLTWRESGLWCEWRVFSSLAGLDSVFENALQNAKQLFHISLPQMTKYCVMRKCENILCGYLYDGDLVFVILKGIYGF